MSIDRPFDAKKQTNETGGWDWVRSKSLSVQAGTITGLSEIHTCIASLSFGIADADLGITHAGSSASVHHTQQPRLLWGL